MRFLTVRIPGGQWLLAAVILIGTELVMLGGAAAEHQRPGMPVLGLLGYGLPALAGVTLVACQRWPTPAFVVGLGTVLAYAGLGYPINGPIVLVVPITLYATVRPDRPWRAAAFAAVASSALLAAYGISHGGLTLDAQTLPLPLWMAGVVLVAYLMARRSRQTAALRDAESLRLVTEERLRIARELHDVVSHSISMINVQAGMAAHVLDRHPEQAREALLAIKAASKEALRELRGILGVLRSVDEAELRTPAPGLARLSVLVEATTRAGLPTTVSVVGTPQRLAPTVDLTAYRIIQEALTNALRYAGPATVRVEIAYADGCVRLAVTDDGAGTPDATPGSGHGIAGMRERVAATGGTLAAGPLADRGFRVTAHLPVDRRAS